MRYTIPLLENGETVSGLVLMNAAKLAFWNTHFQLPPFCKSLCQSGYVDMVSVGYLAVDPEESMYIESQSYYSTAKLVLDIPDETAGTEKGQRVKADLEAHAARIRMELKRIIDVAKTVTV